jgi:hypothetical protein
MVVRLIGKVEGQDVIFTRLKGDIWTAEVPAQKSGRYVKWNLLHLMKPGT